MFYWVFIRCKAIVFFLRHSLCKVLPRLRCFSCLNLVFFFSILLVYPKKNIPYWSIVSGSDIIYSYTYHTVSCIQHLHLQKCNLTANTSYRPDWICGPPLSLLFEQHIRGFKRVGSISLNQWNMIHVSVDPNIFLVIGLKIPC